MELESRLISKKKMIGNAECHSYGPRTVTYIFTAKQAAEYCKCTVETIRNWVDLGLLPAFKECSKEEVPAGEATWGKTFYLKEDLNNALRVIHARVPVKKFSV